MVKFCPECGTKLNGPMKFCPECGFDLRKLNAPEPASEPAPEPAEAAETEPEQMAAAEPEETVLGGSDEPEQDKPDESEASMAEDEPEPEDGIFTAADYDKDGHICLEANDFEFHFNPSLKDYIELSTAYDTQVKELLAGFDKEYAESREMICSGNMDFAAMGAPVLQGAARVAVKILTSRGLFTVNPDQLLAATEYSSEWNAKSASEIWNDYAAYAAGKFSAISDKAQAERQEREMQKEDRPRVIGGGFGLSGAAKGMLEAGAINMMTGAAYSLFNSFGDSGTDSREESELAELYGNGTVLNTLRYGLGLASEVIKKNLLCYLQITPLREDGPAKARAILDNIASGAIEGYSNIRQAAADALLNNPFEKDAYLWSLINDGDEDGSLRAFAAKFHLGDFLDYEKEILFKVYLTAFAAGKEYSFDYENPCELYQALNEEHYGFSWLSQDLLRLFDGEADFFVLALAHCLTADEIRKILHEIIDRIDDLGLMSEKWAGLRECCISWQGFADMIENDVPKYTDEDGEIIVEPIRKYGDKEYPPMVDVGAYFGSQRTSAVIPEGTIAIGDFAFSNCKNLEKVALPDGLTTIGRYAFCGCEALQEVAIPQSVKTIDDSAFANCKKLKKAWLYSYGVESWGHDVFVGCSLMHSVFFPESVTYFGGQSKDCPLLDVYSSADAAAFLRRRGLLHLTTLLRTTDKSAVKLSSPTVEADSSKTGFSFFKDVLKAGMKEIKAQMDLDAYNEDPSVFVVPDSCCGIEDELFAGNQQYKKVIFQGSNILELAAGAFKDSALEEIELPDKGCSIISHEAFAGSALQHIVIPSDIMIIGDSAFDGCLDLETVQLADGLQSIGKRAFYTSNDDFKGKLTELFVPASVTKLGENFVERQATTVLCPEGSFAAQYCQEQGYSYKIIDS